MGEYELEQKVLELDEKVNAIQRINELIVRGSIDGTERMVVSVPDGSGGYTEEQIDPAILLRGVLRSVSSDGDVLLSDKNSKVLVNANDVTLTIPNDLGWANGDTLIIIVYGTGFSLASGGNVTVNNPQSFNDVLYSVYEITKTSDNIYSVYQNTSFNGGSVSLISKTGSTIVFTENAEYNAAIPLNSGNLTLDNTSAIAGVTSRVYYNGSTEPQVSGINIISRRGTFVPNRLNIYFFEYTTQGEVIMVIFTDQTPQLIPPINFVSTVQSSNTILLDWDDNSNANNYILERDTNSDFSTVTQIYSGATSQYTDTGLTTGTTYYYRVKSQGSGFIDSLYSTSIEVAGEIVPEFNIVGLVENPTGTFENPLSGNYPDAYGVSTLSINGDFEFSVELEANDVAGCMFGVSSHGVNAPFNDGTNPWSHLGYVRNSDSQLMYSTGTPTATPIVVTYGSGNTVSLRRVSNNLKLFFNETEAHDFGTVSGALFVHISTFHMFFIKNPLIKLI